MNRIRVLHCPNTVAGNPQGLARAERQLGLESRAIAFRRSPYGYETDEILWEERDNLLRREIKRWRLLWRALRDFDIIHFNFGQSLMPHPGPANLQASHGYLSMSRRIYEFYARSLELHDLAWLKRAGKGIVVTYQGDDARQGDFCLANFEISPAGEVEPGYYSPASDAHKRARIATVARYADRIFALNPDLLHILPPTAQFLPYSHIDLRDWQVVDKGNPGSAAPVIVHAPTHRGVKGTRFVLDAIARLQAEGIALELLLVEKLSHAEARRVYERADLLVDQLLAGWYGGLAVELMALGKPVVCYIRESDLKFIPPQMQQDLPIINARPATLHDVLREWLTVRKDELAEIGRRSRAYVERWHDPLKIAARLKSEYEAIMATKRQGSRN